MTNEIQSSENDTDYVMHARRCHDAEKGFVCVLKPDVCPDGGMMMLHLLMH